MHDYQPAWDYDVINLHDLALDSYSSLSIEKYINNVLSDLMEYMPFSKVEVFYVKPYSFPQHPTSDTPIAMYCNGTSSLPVIGLDPKALLDLSMEFNCSFEHQLKVSLAHELAHAYQEAMDFVDMENGFNEDSAESFARAYADWGVIDFQILEPESHCLLPEISL